MKKIIIYTDGGSRGNPGPSAIGVVFYNEKNQIIKSYSEYIGDNLTNNEAEYQAVIFALKKFKSFFGKELVKNSDVELRADSELIVKQFKGEYKVSNLKIQALFIEVWNLRTEFKNLKITFIPREKNIEADRLVNEALDNQNKNQKLL